MKTNIMTIKQHVAQNKRLLSRHDDRHLASPPAKTKNVRDKSNVLGDVKIISEELKKIL